MWWFSFLPVVGELTNSGGVDPTVIKSLILAGAVLCTVLLIGSFFVGVGWSRSGMRQTMGLWHAVLCLVLLIPLTVWAWLWDDRQADLFDGGVPIWPVFPSMCDSSCRELHSAQQLAYIEWNVILLLSVTFHSIIIASVIHGWRIYLAVMAVRVAGISGPNSNNGIGKSNNNNKKKKKTTSLGEAADILLQERGGGRNRR